MAQRKIYNKQDYTVDLENKIVILSDSYYEKLSNFSNKWTSFKKIGGSSIGDVLEVDSFKSSFSAYCHIARLKMPILQTKYIDAGVALEPKIFEFFKNLVHKKNPELEVNHYDAAEYNYDYFSGIDVIGGVPDGAINNLKMILEIKTANAKKRSEWDKEIPKAYLKQAQLYAHLMGYTRIKFLTLFLKDSDYLNPENAEISNSTFKVYDASALNKSEIVEDIDFVKNWYNQYTNTKVSPQFKPLIDKDQIDYLLCENREQWKELFNRWKAQKKVDENIDFESV
ncbi:MAGa7180 family putative nuclease [Mycoplasmopsis synoviae]|uniref:MAGa7180 family putative nuclease n=1 Tax=Mycoplasmopsis synoviae TaxID=2109 RepID=UPI001CE06E08|nr:YqaJ viral recombinase family protein [Mycoplasmopsis synoviae]UBX97364.1 YqaJ viral recombinase family protein [Mycoplasmopsis synoviae]UBX98052.1 YqaJ viral recombinase family protein [Mycoplasmopsis synoviae]UBX98988.1 YqaJ viral recombinase family protein [Mycoplasmopsis synoviae]UBX99252.1 YqaJ viral recombinase family protein [Mycoplasmopsis synoviae]UBY00192.1 YqaJ viral recombinase family protein [Mycoplasmopsis synoviae]